MRIDSFASEFNYAFSAEIGLAAIIEKTIDAAPFRAVVITNDRSYREWKRLISTIFAAVVLCNNVENTGPGFFLGLSAAGLAFYLRDRDT